MLLGQADPEVDAERLGDLVLEERAERLAAHPSYELADGPAEVDEVVAVASSRLPEGRLGGDAFDYLVPVDHEVGREFAAEGRNADRVVEHHPDRRRLFAVGGELGPVLGDGRFDVELAAARQDVRAQRHRALRAAHDDRDRVALPRSGHLAVDRTAPHVDDGFALVGDTQRRAHFVVVVEVADELVDDRLEPRVELPSHNARRHVRFEYFHKRTLADSRRRRWPEMLVKKLATGLDSLWVMDL